MRKKGKVNITYDDEEEAQQLEYEYEREDLPKNELKKR